MRRALRVPVAVGAPVLTAVLVGCLFRPPPSSQHVGNDGGMDAAISDARPGDAKPTPDGHIVADAPGSPDASGLPDGGSTTGTCMPMQPIDPFDENTDCGSGMFSGSGTAIAANSMLTMKAGGSAAVCTWNDVPASSGFYVQLLTTPAATTVFSMSAGANLASITIAPDGGSDVTLTFNHTPGSGTPITGVATPVYLGFKVSGSTVTGAYGSNTMTSTWSSLGTATFTAAPMAVMVQLSTQDTGSVSFAAFDCI